MRASLFTILLATTFFQGCSQGAPYDLFVNSFTEIDEDKVAKFSVIVQTKNPMTMSEASLYVYHNDTSRLYCIQKIINMETEKVIRINRELYLPDKSLLLKGNGFTLIGYSSYECQNPNALFKNFLTLKTLTSDNREADTLLAYIGTETDFILTGMINPRQNKIFILGHINDPQRSDAVLYEIDSNARFKKIDEKLNIKLTDNFFKAADACGWGNFFRNE
jgi:hypothetical protein